jgi:hypothetical protein
VNAPGLQQPIPKNSKLHDEYYRSRSRCLTLMRRRSERSSLPIIFAAVNSPCVQSTGKSRAGILARKRKLLLCRCRTTSGTGITASARVCVCIRDTSFQRSRSKGSERLLLPDCADELLIVRHAQFFFEASDSLPRDRDAT